MAQVLPHVQTGLEGFGSGLGQGISASLQNLAQNKLQQMQQAQQQQQTYNTLKKIPGFTDEGARFIASLPPEVAKNFYGNIGSLFPENFFINQQPQQQQQQTPPSQRQQSLAPLQQSPAQQQNQPALQEVLQSLSNPYEAAKLIAQTKFQPNQAQNIVESQPASAQQLQTKALLKQPQEIKVEQPKTANIKKAPVNLFESPKEKYQREVASAKAQARIDKETSPIYREILKAEHGAKESERRISRMEELLQKGNLGAPIRNSILKTISEGIFGPHGPKVDLKFLMTADAQEFDKLAADFAKSASEFFPGRLTDTDLRTFMASLPSLSLTKAGNLRLINSMRSLNRAAELKAQTMKQIIKENGNKRPENLELLIDERISPQLDQLSQEFINAPRLGERLGGGVVRY